MRGEQRDQRETMHSHMACGQSENIPHQSEVMLSIIKLVESEFGKEAPLTIVRGKVHEYLGMTINFSTKGKVRFSMIDYIQNILDKLPVDMDGKNSTAAANFLFDMNEDCERLDGETFEFFHHNTAKLLFLCKQAPPDIQTAVAFLCTRVKGPDTDDYKKLAQVVKYIWGTVNMPLTLEANGSSIVKRWVDASNGVHSDMRSHTGEILSLGKGAVQTEGWNEKLNQSRIGRRQRCLITSNLCFSLRVFPSGFSFHR